MNRDEFLDLLSRVVADGTITEAQAVELLRQYDAGEIDNLDMLAPLPPEQTGRVIEEEEIALALLLLASLLQDRQTTRGVTLASRISLVNTIQDELRTEARTLAGRLARREITVAQWQQEAIEQVERRVVAMHTAGTGRGTLGRAAQGRIQRAVRREAAFLSRFADEIAAKALQGQALSEAQMGARLELYGGVGREEFFRGYEESEVGEEVGVVVEYVSQDDPATCVECLVAERDGPYLVGSNHPYPGSVCLGGSRCRCRLEYVYDPDTYATLI